MRAFTIELLRSVKFWLCSILLVSITWAVDLSLRPYILKVIIDRISIANSNNVISYLFGPLALYSAISLLIIVMFRFRDYIYLNLNAIMKLHISDSLMQKMMQHSLVVFQNNFSGNLANKIKDVMSGIPDIIKSIDELFAIFISLLIAIFMLWTINYKFSILLIVWLIFFISITCYFTKRAKQLCLTSAELNSMLVGQLVDILSNIISIKLFASRNDELKQLKTLVNIKVNSDKRREWYFLTSFAVLGLSFILYQIFGFVLLVNLFKNGLVTTGDFALLISLNIAIVNELWSLSSRFISFTEILGNVVQGLKISLQPIDIVDNAGATTLNVTSGTIVFDKVMFSYHELGAIFSDKSVTINAGQKVGLVGYSGGGKTTFVNLILRLYEITSGKISIDGQNIQDVTQDSLHENISMIPQDPFLFHRTLMENIRYGRSNASDAEVMQAAKKAHAHDFIMNLPNQYNSLVGERGVKLSGGQRQRIAIARAILKNAPILILDEATSQLDSVTEELIQDSLWSLMQGKTTIVIAHRLSTLMHMDRILVFENGKIVEDGSHRALLVKHGLYKTLWGAQVGGFLPDMDTQ